MYFLGVDIAQVQQLNQLVYGERNKGCGGRKAISSHGYQKGLSEGGVKMRLGEESWRS